MIGTTNGLGARDKGHDGAGLYRGAASTSSHGLRTGCGRRAANGACLGTSSDAFAGSRGPRDLGEKRCSWTTGRRSRPRRSRGSRWRQPSVSNARPWLRGKRAQQVIRLRLFTLPLATAKRVHGLVVHEDHRDLPGGNPRLRSGAVAAASASASADTAMFNRLHRRFISNDSFRVGEGGREVQRASHLSRRADACNRMPDVVAIATVATGNTCRIRARERIVAFGRRGWSTGGMLALIPVRALPPVQFF